MPRLVVIQGPRSGDWVQLQQDNYLGFRGSQLAVSHVNDLDQHWAYLRILPDRAELHNLTVGSHMFLNGRQFKNAFVNHGDTITMYNTQFSFLNNDSDHYGGVVPNLASGPAPRPQSGPHQQPNAQNTPALNPAYANMPVTSSMALNTALLQQGGEDELLGGISSNNEEQISARVKFNNQDEMMAALRDGERMKVLLKVSSKLSNIDLSALLKELLDIIFDVMPADRGTILLYAPEKRRFRTMASKTRWGGEAKVRISRTIAKEVLRSKASILSADAQSDQRFQMGLSIVDEDIRSAICVPILSNDEIIGLIHLDTQDEDNQFDKGDCELLTAICMQAALAIENARLVSQIAEQERMKYELDLAATIQQQLLPRKLPEARGVEVYGKMIPAKELGGDYFDFIDLGNGEFAICVGDVSGKGLPAGLVMIMARSYFRPLIRAHQSPRTVICEANKLLYEDTRPDMFMSAVLLRWSDRENAFRWTGAGHEHLLIYRARTRKTEALRAGGLVLAMTPAADGRYEENQLVLETGDAIVLYTDGITEAQNPQGGMFANDSDLSPLINLVDRYGHLSAQEMLEAILWEMRNFMGNAPQADDITLVTVKKR